MQAQLEQLEKDAGIEWREYRLDELFGKSTRGRRLKSADRVDGTLPFVTAGETDMGISAWISNDVHVFSKNTVTIDMFGSAKYRNYDYGADDHVAVVHTEKWHPHAVLFLTSAIHKSSYTGQFDYSRNFYATDADELRIKLPTIIENRTSKRAFDFIEKFVATLHAERVATLHAYLMTTGLKDCVLTADEEKALDKFNSIEWGRFKLGSLFEKIKTKKLSFKAEELPKQRTGNFTLPCLTSSFKNQGLNYFAPKDGATILKNVISIPSNSDVYRAYYQSNEFTVLSDAYAIRWIFSDVKLLPSQYLFAVQCINKVTNLPIYSYKNKLGGWNVVKNKHIRLPVKSDNTPDYAYMSLLVQAMQKVVIKNVVDYLDVRIEKTGEVLQ